MVKWCSHILLAVAFTGFTYQSILAQDVLDSLRSKVDASQSDQERVEATFEFLKKFRREDQDSALVLAKENLLLAQEIDDRYFQAKMYQQIGLIFRSLYKYEDAIESYNEGLKITAKDTFDLAHADILNTLAYALGQDGKDSLSIAKRLESIPIYEVLGDYDALFWAYFNVGVDSKRIGQMMESKRYLEKAERIADSVGYRDYIPYVKNVIGNLLSDLGQWSKAMEEYQVGLKIAEELSIEEDIALIMGNLAIVHKDLGDFEKAEDYYRRVLEIELRNEVEDVHYVMYNLGTLNMEREMNKAAIPFLVESLARREEIGLKGLQLSSASMLAEAYYLTEDADSAQYYIDYVKQLLPEVEIPFDRATAFEQLGNIYLSREEWKNAEAYLTQGYLINKRLGHKEHRYSTAESLYKLYRARGNEAKALEFLEESRLLQDSLINKEQVREITKLEEEYKHEKAILQKEVEIQLLEARDELAQLRLMLLSGIASGILIIGFFIARYRIRAKALRAEKLQEIGDFKEAMTGMIAHDLKNPLSVIINSNEAKDNKEMAGKMLRLVNNMLDVQRFENTEVRLNVSSHSIGKLIDESLDQVAPLVDEKQINIQKKIENVVVDVDPEIISRVLVNLLTNAIKYSSTNSTVEVRAKVLGEDVQVAVKDGGLGIPKDQIETIFNSFEQLNPKSSGGVGSTGLGLTFVKLAVEAHGSRILVESENRQGSTFSFKLPAVATGFENYIEKTVEVHVELSMAEKKMIEKQSASLQALNVHQISEIEKELVTLKSRKNANVDQWVEAVLDAAYSGNKSKYEELIG
ncbi:MAG: tetratricopeptide repeat protein [Cyclobacteriaceae bacterium]